MRQFVSIEALARVWRLDELLIREAADRAGVVLFRLLGRFHADKSDVKRLGDALFATNVATGKSA